MARPESSKKSASRSVLDPGAHAGDNRGGVRRGRPPDAWSQPVHTRTPFYLVPVKFLYVGVREFLTAGGLARSSSLAYASLLSLIPLTVVALSVVGLVRDRDLAREELPDVINQFLWEEPPTYEISGTILVPEDPEVEAALGDLEIPEEGKTITAEELALLQGALGSGAVPAIAKLTRRDELVAWLGTFAENLKDNLSVIGIIGALVLLVSTISLFNSIESALNELWHLRPRRNLVRKFLVLWALLTLGPLLLAAGVVVGNTVSAQAGGLDFLPVPFMFTVAAFLFLYRFVPSTRVSWTGAMVAAIVAGALWEFAKLLFRYYLARVFDSSNNAILIAYGSLALIPVFLLWLYISWVIALLGAKLGYVWQHLDTYEGAGWTALPHTAEVLEFEAIEVVRKILDCQDSARPRITCRTLARQLRQPHHRIEDIVTTLTEGEILREDSDGNLLVVRPPDRLTLEEVTRVIRGGGRYDDLVASDAPGKHVLDLLGQVDRSRRELLGHTTFAELRGRQPAKDAALPS
jgi:membrane protein